MLAVKSGSTAVRCLSVPAWAALTGMDITVKPSLRQAFMRYKQGYWDIANLNRCTYKLKF